MQLNRSSLKRHWWAVLMICCGFYLLVLACVWLGSVALGKRGQRPRYVLSYQKAIQYSQHAQFGLEPVRLLKVEGEDHGPYQVLAVAHVLPPGGAAVKVGPGIDPYVLTNSLSLPCAEYLFVNRTGNALRVFVTTDVQKYCPDTNNIVPHVEVFIGEPLDRLSMAGS